MEKIEPLKVTIEKLPVPFYGLEFPVDCESIMIEGELSEHQEAFLVEIISRSAGLTLMDINKYSKVEKVNGEIKNKVMTQMVVGIKPTIIYKNPLDV